ncbi:hypothetical protein ACSBR1_038886 [Camellia fascicularis]
MDLEFVTEGVSEDDTFNIDQNNDDYSTFEGERCGICMDIVIDRGVLDCCQHWFCFTCIDNWATITNLCPLCQNEFQLITCVPVYDTIGSNNLDEDSFSREDDWCIEEKNNSLSFPSYYIDENAVICLDGDGCKIRSGSLIIEEDSNLDTSIACDSCDIWYHAFCVGFDPEGACENSWLCPRCLANENPQKSDVIQGNNFHLENGSSECLVDAAFCGKVSVSVADAGETAVVVSLVEGNQVTEEPSEKLSSTSEVDKDLKIEMLISSSSANVTKLETPSTEKTSTQPALEAQELEPCLSKDTPFSLHCISSGQIDDMKNDVAWDIQQKSSSEEYLLPASKMEPDLKDSNVLEITRIKRKRRHCSDDVHTVAGDVESKTKVLKASTKKARADRSSQVIDSKDQASESVSDESQKCISEKENDASDVMSIVRGTYGRPFKGQARNNHTDGSSKEGENAAGLRVKKIMRRAAEDKESSMLVQNLRKEIREAVRNRSFKEFGGNLFDPKLLDAFRAAVAGSVTEPAKKPLALVVKDKKLLLQKGKIRENLTKKIYGIGGRRKRAWTRDCEIEFWKHRCLKPGRPEKIETLKSVLSLLRNSSDSTEIKQGTEGKATNSILSRLYLADNSVFPRKDDIKPFADLKATGLVENKGHPSSLANHSAQTLQMNQVSSQVGIRSSDNKGNESTTVTSVKGEAASSKVLPNKCPEVKSATSLSGSKVNSQKEMMGKSDDIKKDKRKWALEVLARKASASGSKATQEKQEDNVVLKGSYPLLAQLPIEMRPVLATSRHNKVPMSVRQAQLYRLTEHFLRKANLPVICRTADTELAVADAVNIEKEVADRSNSKLVYVNLMSQELLHRSDNIKSSRDTESDPSPSSPVPTDRSEQATTDLSDDPMIEEALKNAGFLSDDSPLNSPSHQMEEINDENDVSKKIGGDEPENVFEMDSHPELDIYGDFEYDLEDEDFIGSSALKISKLQQEETKMKVVFSTLSCDRSNNANDLEIDGRTTAVEASKGSSSLHECGTDTSIRSSGMDQAPLTDEGGEELSLAECEELYGPDKEPLVKRFPETTLVKSRELMADDVVPEKVQCFGSSENLKTSELGSESCAENLVVARVGLHSSGGEDNGSGCSQTSKKIPVKEKQSNTDTNKQSNSFNSVSKKVEAYIKEHVRPLCKSGVITVEQYRWAVGKTTDKVMKYHSKEKNANFLVKEGEKVKKLAEQYVETAQQTEKK